MPTLVTAVWLLLWGIGLGLILTRLARNAAARIGMMDGPDGHRKTQESPVPVAGGLAVLAAAVSAILVVAIVEPDVAAALTADARKSLALLAAALLITIVGLIDDRYNLRARYKLLGQTAAVLVLVLGGDFVIHKAGLFGFTAELDSYAIPFTVVWLLACVNALNLIDGMDGFLGTVGGIALLSLAVVAALTGHLFASVVALALAGAVFGFLWWNLPPATVYMGDAGSMLIGLVIGAVAIPASLKGPATVALGAPLAVLILPMFDTTAAVVRRKLTGRGMATPDRGHLHHVMLKSGLTAPRVLGIVAVLGLVAAGGALASTAWHNDLFALVAASGVVLALVVGKLFGNAELGLIRTRVSRAFRRLWAGVGDVQSWGMAVRLQGIADWDRVWGDLLAHAKPLNLRVLCLDVNSPAMHENYHARWSNPVALPEAQLWRLEIPLHGAEGRSLGRLAISAERDVRSFAETLRSIAELVAWLELLATEAIATTRPAVHPSIHQSSVKLDPACQSILSLGLGPLHPLPDGHDSPSNTATSG